MGCVLALEPPRAVGRGPELSNTRQHRSPPLRLGEVRSRGTRGNVGAVLGGGVHAAMPEPHLSKVALARHYGARGCMRTHALPLVLT
jgi:hypothetical protein